MFLSRPLSGWVLASVIAVGLMPGAAQAKWIKATVSGLVTTTPASPPADLEPGDAITLNFIIQNYLGTRGTPNVWSQTDVKPNYSQLFGYGTSSPQLQGNYNASSLPYDSTGLGNIISSNDNGSNFFLRVGTDQPTSGLSAVVAGTARNVLYISLGGTVNLATPASGSSDVVDFLSASLGSRSCTTCTGFIQTTVETPFSFTWNTISFEQIEAVPAPLPIAGVLAGFRFSRKIRSRIKAN